MLLAWPAQPASAAEECIANAIDQTGRCRGRGFARKAVERELGGVDTPAPPPPEGLDPAVLAGQLTGGFATGELYPVEGRRGDWVLVAHRAEAAATTLNQYELIASSDKATLLIALLRWQPAATGEDKPVLRVLATTERLTADTAAESTADTEPAAGEPVVATTRATVPCVDPEQGDELDSVGGYPDIGQRFRWVALAPGHRVLAAGVARSEGYAGGAGSFAGEILLDPRQGRLAPVACYAVSRYQMFGGDWNPDGTRQHPESQAAWTLQPVPGGEWPRLRLRPDTADTPGAHLRWDSGAGHYVEE